MPLAIAIAITALVLLFLLSLGASRLSGKPWVFPWRRFFPARAEPVPPSASAPPGSDGGREEDEDLSYEWLKRSYRTALRRSPALLLYTLGARELPVVEHSRLMADVAMMAAINLAGPKGRLPGSIGTPMYIAAPLWEPGPGGMAMRQMCWIPAGFTRYAFGPGAQERLRDEPRLQGLVAELYAHYQQRPIDLLGECYEVRSIFLDPPESTDPYPSPERTSGRPHRIPAGVHFQPHHGALSALMADVSRHLVIGNSLREIRAVHRLDDEPALWRKAWRRVAAFREVEDSWFDDPTAKMHEDVEREELEILASLGYRMKDGWLRSGE